MRRQDPLTEFWLDNQVFIIIFGIMAFILTVLILRAKALPDTPPREPQTFEEFERRQRIEAQEKKNVRR